MSPADPLRNLGVRLTARGGELRVFSANASSIDLCIFDEKDPTWIAKTIPLSTTGDGVWSATHAIPGAWHALRAQGIRADRADERVRPVAHPARSLRARAEARPERRLAQLRPGRRIRLGRGREARHPARSHGLVRGARQGAHAAQPRRAGGAARHLRRARAPVDDRLPEGSRRHHDRAAPDPSGDQRTAPHQDGPDQLLGLQHPQLLHPARARTRPGMPSSAAPVPCCANSRAWCGCCTRPVSRSCSTWSTTTPPRRVAADRPARSAASTTPPTTATAGRQLPRHHRLRQHDRLLARRDPAPRARLAAVLGERGADRRIPLRPRRHPRPRRRRGVRSASSAARGDRERPGAGRA